MIGRAAGTLPALPAVGVPVTGGTTTVVFANDGMKRDTGSSRCTVPSSTSIMTATLVIALLIEAMRNSVSVVIGTFFSTSRRPAASW